MFAAGVFSLDVVFSWEFSSELGVVLTYFM